MTEPDAWLACAEHAGGPGRRPGGGAAAGVRAQQLPENSRSPILQFLGYLWNPLSWAMEAAAIIAIVLLDYADFALILFLLLLNAVISFREESSAVRRPC